MNEELASVAFEYDSVRHAAFVTLEAETCMRSAYLLETLVNMARERLLSELRDGNIFAYELYEERFKWVWKHLRSSRVESRVRIAIGAGHPRLKGLRVQSPEIPTGPARLILYVAPQEALCWRLEWVLQAVNVFFRAQNIGYVPNPSQIHLAWLRACMGDYPEDGEYLATAPHFSALRFSEAWRLQIAKGRRALTLFVRDPKVFTAPEEFESLFSTIEAKLWDLREGLLVPTPFVPKSTLKASLQESACGAAGLGYEIPFVALGGVLFGEPRRKVREMLQLSPLECMDRVLNSEGTSRVQAPQHYFDNMRHRSTGSFESLAVTRAAHTNPLEDCTDLLFQDLVLSHSIQALRKVSPSETAFVGTTVGINETAADALRLDIATLIADLALLREPSSEARRIHHISLQFFPFTQVKEGVHVAGKEENKAPAAWAKVLIREMVGLAEFSDNPAWIRARLLFPLTESQVRQCLLQLKSEGLIQYDEKSKRYIPIVSHVLTATEVAGEQVIRYHEEMLYLAQAAQSVVPQKRYYSKTLTIALTAQETGVIKKRLEEFSKGVLNVEAQCLRRDQVYYLGIQMIPLHLEQNQD